MYFSYVGLVMSMMSIEHGIDAGGAHGIDSDCDSGGAGHSVAYAAGGSVRNGDGYQVAWCD